jgi:hypothetical protein
MNYILNLKAETNQIKNKYIRQETIVSRKLAHKKVAKIHKLN